MGASFAAGPAKDSWLVRQKQVVACHVKVLLLPVTTFLPCFTNDWTQLQGSGQRESKLAKAWVWRREGYLPLPGIIITNTKSTKNATSTNSTTSTKSTVGTTNAKSTTSTTRTKLPLPLTFATSWRCGRTRWPSLWKGKCSPSQKYERTRMGRSWQRLSLQHQSCHVFYRKLLHQVLSSSQVWLCCLHRSMDWSRGTSTASEWRQLTWAVR